MGGGGGVYKLIKLARLGRFDPFELLPPRNFLSPLVALKCAVEDEEEGVGIYSRVRYSTHFTSILRSQNA